MQAIQTKYLPATNVKGSRIKATCDRGSVTISYPYELSGEAVHVKAVNELVARFIAQDAVQYGTPTTSNPWGNARVCGGLPDGSYCHVFTA